MIEQRVTLRYGAQQIPAIVQAVQGDTGRDVIFELADYEIPAGATANYYIDKPDDTAIYNSAEVISSTEILAHLTEQALAVPGRNNGQVRILSDGEVITSFDFVLEVEAFRGILHLQSETEINIFDAAIQDAVDEAIEEIQAQTPVVTGMQNSIAPTYSSSSTYAVGDYVMYNAQLYRCKTEITTAEAWTAVHWTQVPLANDVNDLKSAINHLDKFFEHGENYFNKDTVKRGYFINSDTGAETFASNSFCASDWIKVEPNTDYYLLTAFGCAGYNASKEYAQKFSPEYGHLVTGANTEYIRFGMYYSQADSNYLVKGTTAVIYPPYEENLKVDALPEIPPEKIDAHGLEIAYSNITDNPLNVDLVNRLNKATITTGKYVDVNTGELSNNASFFASDFIYIGDVESIKLSYTFTSAFYNSSKAYVSSAGSGSLNADETLTVPQGVEYIRVSTYNQYLDIVQVGENVSRDNYIPYGKATIDNALIYESQIITEPNSGKIDGFDVAFLLPNTIYLRPNEDFSLYYNGIVKNYFALGGKYYVAQEAVSNGVYSAKGETYNYKWHCTPTAGENFSMEFRIIEKATGKTITSKTVSFVTSASKSSASKNAVVIGDSFVDGFNVVPRLVEMIEDSGNTLVSLGVNSTDYPSVKDCGWAGYTYQWVTGSATGYLRSDRPLSDAVWDAGWGENEEHGWTTGQTYADLTAEQRSHGHTRNEFWNPSTNQFDFSYYMSHYQNGKSCDLLISEYGLNDVGWITTDNAVSLLPTLKSKIDAIIASAKAYNANIKIVLYLICPNADDNNTIGWMNKSFPNYERTIINCGLFNEMLLENYQNDPNVIIMASNGNFDNRYGIRSGEYHPVKFDSSITETHTIDIHPTAIGSKYIADTMANVVHNLL